MFLLGVQAVVVPGKASPPARPPSTAGTTTDRVFTSSEGDRSEQIIELLSAIPRSRAVNSASSTCRRRAGHSGLTNGFVSQDIQPGSGTEIFYSIQATS